MSARHYLALLLMAAGTRGEKCTCSSSPADSCSGVLCGRASRGVEVCRGDCAALVVTTVTGQEHSYYGTKQRMRQKNVASVRTVGTGCFEIFPGRSFTGDSVRVQGGQGQELHEWTTVR